MTQKPLQDRVAVVTGATRGTGRGIARMLGAAGATVYCTGRSVKGHPATAGRPETIEQTAEMVTSEGGKGIAVRTDHTVEAEVERLFARIRDEQNRLDVLVNDIWGGDEMIEWGSPFWELDTTKGFRMLEGAVDSHIITSRIGVPIMIEQNSGLIVEVTDGDTMGYRGNLFYDLAKNATIRLGYAMSRDLHAHRITALTVTPGFLRSEAMLDGFGVTEENWRDGIAKDSFFEESETPCYMGRGVAALAADPDVASKNGGLYSSGSLAKEYGFTDLDGRQPDWGSYFAARIREILDNEETPDEMSLYNVRARMNQIELDPAEKEECARLRGYLDRYE